MKQIDITGSDLANMIEEQNRQQEIENSIFLKNSKAFLESIKKFADDNIYNKNREEAQLVCIIISFCVDYAKEHNIKYNDENDSEHNVFIRFGNELYHCSTIWGQGSYSLIKNINDSEVSQEFTLINFEDVYEFIQKEIEK